MTVVGGINENLSDICDKFVKTLDESVEKNLAEGILLSGGLDTSILAYLASKRMKPKAFTAALLNTPAPDVKYAKLVAKELGLRHLVHRFNENELYGAIEAVVKAVESFDPMEIRNDVTVYIGLKKAKENGISTVMTGDGCDELFAGYSYFFGLGKERLNLELHKIWEVMRFFSVHMAKALGMEVKLPYLDPEFKRLAMEVSPDLKVRSENGQMFGKWVLRKAFEGLLPEEILWRAKTPVESGSGTIVLPKFFNSIIPDVEFREKRSKYLKKDKVVIRDKEQLFYYEIYRSAVGVPHPTDLGGKLCPWCNSSMPVKSSYCRICGASLRSEWWF